MSKTGIILTIFATGFISGIFFGFYLLTGENVNPENILIKAGNMFCDAIKNLNPETSAQCKDYMFYASLLISVLGILEIIALISAAGNWITGISAYLIGFVIGVVLVFFSGG
ncbi:hypothetical protein GAH_01373 [Geoglobus ahangari]|uniref:Uncharacterized protein n=1 Tax=Geoglobus ahangari TaxID=113653 RepID=A0A0F7DBM0_9EURY|nr:hypothetical protein [Geoglobus ahangari]AKG91326.1 hypothetical protein GAH_01373 [Geoglobus ahangari]